MTVKPIIVSGPLPPSTNHLYYNRPDGGRGLTKEGKEYKNKLKWALKRAGIRGRDATPPFALWIKVYFPNAHKADVSNRLKVAEDALMEHLGHDDSLVYRVILDKWIDRQNPRIEMELHHMERKLEV